jgi:glycerophosphoryl diester phosphodiesterase
VRHSEAVPIAYRDQRGPLAIAHRGGAGLAAENTLAAFSRSYALGFRCLETDVRTTADGQLVAFHDATLRRVTGVWGTVSRSSLDRLSRLRVLGDGQIVPLPVLLAAYPDAHFTIDVKDRAAIEPLAKLLVERDAVGRVCAAAQWDSWIDELRCLAGPALTTALSWRRLTHLVATSRPLRPAGAAYAHVPLRLGRVPVFAADLAHRAHDAGVRVVVWTVNEQPTMHRLLDRGVDGIITDRPDLLREVLIARGQWHAPHGSSVPDLVS